MKKQISQQASEYEPQRQEHKAGFQVAASPFNTVKFELGFVVIIGIVLWFIINNIIASFGKQLLILAGYGVIGALWIVFRTRQIVKHQQTGHN